MSRPTTGSCTRLTITYRGDDDESAAEALREALRRIEDGNVSGADTAEDGGFYFASTSDVAPGEWPR